jgi:pyruvate/2-oxoglutarate dehydrogenase complex dihydrolipoamide dehydrogenase (E3) component
MIVIGGGAAGLTSAGISAMFGAKTALVEAKKLGGDCTWYGCVPSKTLLKAAKIAHQFRTADKYGLKSQEAVFEFSDIMKHVSEVQNHIYEDADSPEIYRSMGISVLEGKASFLDANTIVVEGTGNKTLTSRYFIIATGSRPAVPEVEGLGAVPYLTNETIFSLTRQPKKLIVIGGGPIGTEMAQAFTRLGSQVAIVEKNTRILGKDDPELGKLLLDQLAEEGIEFRLGMKVQKITSVNDVIRVSMKSNDTTEMTSIEGDAILLSIGRQANIRNLNLERIGIETNALLHFPQKLDSRHITWCTYADPELAHVGASEKELRERGVEYEVYRFPFAKIDRAITDSDTTGWIKVFAKKWNGKIYGVNILGASAGEMISEYALAMRNGVTLRQMADTIHPYPTYGLGNRRAADQWYVRKQSTTLVRWLQRLFGYRGQLPDTSNPERIL